jgi:hypothetical protein
MKTVVAGPVGTAHLTTEGGHMAPAAKAEEAKESLPVNHPQAGYVDPDLSLVDNRVDPDDLADEREERIAAREEDVKKIADAEDKVVKAERGAVEAAEEPPKEKGKATAS